MLNILSYDAPKPIQGQVNVWPYQLETSEELIESMARNKLGQSTKLSARDRVIEV